MKAVNPSWPVSYSYKKKKKKIGRESLVLFRESRLYILIQPQCLCVCVCAWCSTTHVDSWNTIPPPQLLLYFFVFLFYPVIFSFILLRVLFFHPLSNSIRMLFTWDSGADTQRGQAATAAADGAFAECHYRAHSSSTPPPPFSLISFWIERFISIVSLYLSLSFFILFYKRV